MIPMMPSMRERKRTFRFFGKRYRNSTRVRGNHGPGGTMSHAKEKARRVKQAGHSHSVAQSQELVERRERFTMRQVALALIRERERKEWEAIMKSPGMKNFPTFRKWKAQQ